MSKDQEWYPFRNGKVEATVYHQFCSFLIGGMVGILIVYVSWWFIPLTGAGIFVLNRWYFKKIREIERRK